MKRNYYWAGDVLMDPVSHPPGTRLILSRKSNPVDPYEATVVEWSPSAHRVKLRRGDSLEYWCECWNYNPVVVEILI